MKFFLNLIKLNITNIVFIIFTIYFLFHGLVGKKGLLNYFELNNSTTKKIKTLDQLRMEKLMLQNKVEMLKSELDKDFVDQEARRSLGVANSKERVFVPDNLKSK